MEVFDLFLQNNEDEMNALATEIDNSFLAIKESIRTQQFDIALTEVQVATMSMSPFVLAVSNKNVAKFKNKIQSWVGQLQTHVANIVSNMAGNISEYSISVGFPSGVTVEIVFTP